MNGKTTPQRANQTALLVLDYQSSIVDGMGVSGEQIARAANAIASARAAGFLVIFVTIAFRPGHPEVSERNKIFSQAASAGRFLIGDTGTAIHSDLAPAPDDLVVLKKRISAFAGSDLEVILRARRIEHLVIIGLSTSGSVLSTVRQAADLDFELTVIRDCCADRDAEVDRVVMEKIFPSQATVTTLREFALQLA